MITPLFTISQTENSLILNIKCPFIKASTVEVDVDLSTLRFLANPYFLKLVFNEPLDKQTACSYDIDTGLVTLE
jgi:hypothetical protein